MKRALQILTHKVMINGEPASPAGRQHLLPLKNNYKQMKFNMKSVDFQRLSFLDTLQYLFLSS